MVSKATSRQTLLSIQTDFIHSQKEGNYKIEGDLSQLFSPSSYHIQLKPQTPSVFPKKYIPPSFRHKSEKLDNMGLQTTTNWQSSTLSFLNMNNDDAMYLQQQNKTKKPIEKACMIRKIQSPGIKYHRDKVQHQQRKLVRKLPPPPIGNSVGHGIVPV